VVRRSHNYILIILITSTVVAYPWQLSATAWLLLLSSATYEDVFLDDDVVNTKIAFLSYGPEPPPSTKSSSSDTKLIIAITVPAVVVVLVAAGWAVKSGAFTAKNSGDSYALFC
tara:strand:+ start:60 stop:401 length:342 start_codon:yes stop_codon:yes gene_type:complete